MAVTARPEISKILLDLGIEPVDVYAVDNAEKTYMSALIEGINTLEIANQGDSSRSRILRDELKGLREKRRKINVNKLFARKQVIPTNKIKPQALLPGSADDEKKTGGMDEKAHSILDSIIGILRMGNKQDKKEADTEKKEREAKRRKVRENLLESAKGIAAVGKNLVGKIVSPFRNILGAIGKFLKFVLVGYLFNVVLKWFMDPENQKKIDTLTRFFKDWWPALTFAALAFLTPLGTIIGGLIGFLSKALPALVALSKNPLLVGAGLFTAGALIPQIFPGTVRDEADRAVDESVEQQGEEDTIDQLKQQQESRNIFQRVGDFITGAGAEREEQIQRIETGQEKRYGFFGEIKPKEMNQGGFVSPMVFGESNKDTVPAMLTPGEFVMTKDAVKRYGTNIFEGMNAAASATPNTINNSSSNNSNINTITNSSSNNSNINTITNSSSNNSNINTITNSSNTNTTNNTTTNNTTTNNTTTTNNRNNNSNISTNSIINNITKTIGAFKKGGLVQNFNEGGLVENYTTNEKYTNVAGEKYDPENPTEKQKLALKFKNQMVGSLENKTINLSQGKSDFIPTKTIGLVALEVPLNKITQKTIVLPEKRITKEDQTPMKIGSKTIPDIMIVNRSPYRAMTTRSLGIQDLVGV